MAPAEERTAGPAARARPGSAQAPTPPAIAFTFALREAYLAQVVAGGEPLGQTLENILAPHTFPPDVAAGPVLLIDPMLATGGSACHAVSRLKEGGCTDIQMICLVAAPPGVERMYAQHPDVRVHTASLDRLLDERGYILPGLGDAGDRIFNTLPGS